MNKQTNVYKISVDICQSLWWIKLNRRENNRLNYHVLHCPLAHSFVHLWKTDNSMHFLTNQKHVVPSFSSITPPPPNIFRALRSSQLIIHSLVLWSGGLITVDPRALPAIVAAVVLMVELPCLWPVHPAPQHSAACKLLPPGGQARAAQHPGTDCSSSAPPSPWMWFQIHNPGWGENYHFSKHQVSTN